MTSPPLTPEVRETIANHAQRWHDLWCYCGYKHFHKHGPEMSGPMECPNFYCAEADLVRIASLAQQQEREMNAVSVETFPPCEDLRTWRQDVAAAIRKDQP